MLIASFVVMIVFMGIFLGILYLAIDEIQKLEEEVEELQNRLNRRL